MIKAAMKVRRANPNDADEVARVHVDAWNFTYAGFMPADYLSSLSYDAFAKGWAADIAKADENQPRWVAESNGAIVGFLIAGSGGLEVPGYPNELRAIYTKPGVQRAGTGKALFQAYRDWLMARGEDKFHLWVGKQNERAHRFYEAMGGQRVAERSDRKFGGMVIPEWGYGFSAGASLE
ncbi:MAG: GNAT family N-acetyltransferase [Proteobacteria bacterium]|nr:MAG: GNAT family N-acetyltransferase [Pseudomonadota bacterium]